ncbi:MAG: DNA (cytosine-5-)-methyltransferase [Oscillospiraceae bacterium]
MESIRTVELFAGVGGFRLGLEAASDKFKVIWANQWEPSMREQYAFDCYVAHFGNGKHHVCQDIAKAKSGVPDHDLLVGGFPCQDYSIMKKNSAGIEGTKGVLWWQIDDILREKRPKYVLLENVDRIIRSPAKQCGRDFSIILRCLYEKGYAVEWRVVNAADYGYAQRRRRTFIIAYHNQTQIFRDFAEIICVQGLKSMHRHIMENGIFAKAFPIKNHSRIYVESWVDELEYADISDVSKTQQIYLYNAGVMMNGRIYSVDVIPQQEAPTPIKDILERVPVSEHYFLRDEDMPRWVYAKGAKHEKRHRRDGSQYYFSEGSVPFPEPLDKPSRTTLTSESQVGRTSHVVQDQATGRLRVLTPVECERLNGFPDGWTDTGMPDRMRYFCMGNALVVPLVTRIASTLLAEILLEENQK